MLYNFRDLGGLKTKCQRETKAGLIFRSGNLSHIRPETAQHLSEDKGIRLYIDFRSPTEINRFGEPSELINQKVEWINLGIETNDPDFQKLERPEVHDWLTLYHRLFEKNAEAWLKFLQIVAESDAPIAYGCLFGKDRTGIASSLLLEALNVHEELINKDYALTEQHIAPLYKKFSELWRDRSLNESEIFTHYLQTPEQLMADFLQYARKQAVIQESQSLLEHLPADTRTKLQMRLLE